MCKTLENLFVETKVIKLILQNNTMRLKNTVQRVKLPASA
jgi:hypothetical protein